MEIPELENRQKALEAHPVFNAIRDIDDLRQFMSWHVFAVWDFMSLVKRLQRELTSTQEIWLPPTAPLATRLINEIVLGEESDLLPDGGYMSHFELYMLAMQEIGADTGQIEAFIERLGQGESVEVALQQVAAAPCVRSFVNSTMETVVHGNIYQVLGSFFFGREHVIPDMFKGLLDTWHIDEEQAPLFVYYLKRHIELDGENHGPAAKRLIAELTGDDPAALAQLTAAAEDALESRAELWNGLLEQLGKNPEPARVG